MQAQQPPLSQFHSLLPANWALRSKPAADGYRVRGWVYWGLAVCGLRAAMLDRLMGGVR